MVILGLVDQSMICSSHTSQVHQAIFVGIGSYHKRLAQIKCELSLAPYTLELNNGKSIRLIALMKMTQPATDSFVTSTVATASWYTTTLEHPESVSEISLIKKFKPNLLTFLKNQTIYNHKMINKVPIIIL